MSEVDDAVAGLRGRLLAVAPLLVGEVPADIAHGPLLGLLADSVAADPQRDRIWLLATAVAGGFPTIDELESVRRGLQLAAPGTAFGAVLAGVARTAATRGLAPVELQLVTDRPLVDVDFCAKSAHNTGIQRVVRNTMPHWAAGDADPVLAAWSDDVTGYRPLTADQRSLVLEWRSGRAPAGDEVAPNVLLVPWRTQVVLPEVPARALLARQAAIAAWSGNALSLIGYDAIPIVSADTVVDDESDRFAHYLEVVKHAALVACISQTTAEEFHGVAEAMAGQGVEPPRVETVQLPVDVAARLEPAPEQPRERPLVLMVGSIEPRKNQHAVLSAARTLWAEGIDFELFIVGGGHSWYLAEFDKQVRRLSRAGHHVSVGRGVSDATLATAYRDARMVVFPSLQEGYGLPVAEALATGTPVVTTSYGSTAEIARDGGCLLVDPRDDDQIADAIRKLLLDDELHAELVTQARERRNASWADYADALWAAVKGAAA